MMKLAVTLIANVPYGNALPKRAAIQPPTKYRVADPMPPPIATRTTANTLQHLSRFASREQRPHHFGSPHDSNQRAFSVHHRQTLDALFRG